MSEEKLFEIFINSLNFDVNDYLVEELSDLQNKIIENATFIFKENILGDPKTFGGSIKQNEDKYNEFMKKAELELENVKYKEIKKILKDYLKKLKELILKTCVAIIPVKELPWVNVIFRTIPRIIYEDNNLKFLENSIAYYGEVKCFLERTTVYGKIKDQKPLFAPFTGNLDLKGYKVSDTGKEQKSQNFSFVNAIINSMESTVVISQLSKYHENYQRHGDPICDYFMDNDELLESMEKVNSGLEAGRTKLDIAICGLAFPIPSDNTTLMLVTEEGEDQGKYARCFEALLKLSAASCQAPSIKKEMLAEQSNGVGSPGSPELKTWTQEELVQEAQKRMTAQPDIPSWTEEELEKFSSERSSGIPEDMEVWTEEELQDLAEKRRGGGLNIPEWTPDEELAECSCGYSLRPGWSKCPICGTPVGEPSSLDEHKEESTKESELEPSDEKSETNSDIEEEHTKNDED
ncbi:MAG: hypothetical protein ACFE8E_08255 [Candidatus Hodarchaeota archaeon]